MDCGKQNKVEGRYSLLRKKERWQSTWKLVEVFMLFVKHSLDLLWCVSVAGVLSWLVWVEITVVVIGGVACDGYIHNSILMQGSLECLGNKRIWTIWNQTVPYAYRSFYRAIELYCILVGVGDEVQESSRVRGHPWNEPMASIHQVEVGHHAAVHRMTILTG